MYRLKPGIKRDPVRRWNLPDRIFFGHGACHILAGVFLEDPPLACFHAEKITPTDGFSGNHIYVTDGRIAFDHRGYSKREKLLDHHGSGWAGIQQGWMAAVTRVDFPLLDTKALNARKMLGPDQYHDDPVERARRYLARIDHAAAYDKARRRCEILPRRSASQIAVGKAVAD